MSKRNEIELELLANELYDFLVQQDWLFLYLRITHNRYRTIREVVQKTYDTMRGIDWGEYTFIFSIPIKYFTGKENKQKEETQNTNKEWKMHIRKYRHKKFATYSTPFLIERGCLFALLERAKASTVKEHVIRTKQKHGNYWIYYVFSYFSVNHDDYIYWINILLAWKNVVRDFIRERNENKTRSSM